MPRIPIVGDMVNYIRDGVAHAAIVVGAYLDNTADLFIFGTHGEAGYGIAQVGQTEGPAEGYFWYPKGAKGVAVLDKQLNRVSTDTAVVLRSGSDTVAVNDVIEIDAEQMTVVGVTDPDHFTVTRAVNGTALDIHKPGALVRIGVPPPAASFAERT